MREQLVNFETAKLAKEKGFNHMKANCYGDNMAYDTGQEEGKLIQSGNALNYILAPTQSLLQKWLRKEKELSVKVDDFYTNSRVRYDYSVRKLGHQDDGLSEDMFETYEEALEEGLLEALKLC